MIAPNIKAQQELFRSVLNKSKIGSEQIKFIELHGTGTSLEIPLSLNLCEAYTPIIIERMSFISRIN